MVLSSYQTTRYFASAKTQIRQFKLHQCEQFKLRPITDQTGTCSYKTGKVISKSLKPLTKNEIAIHKIFHQR